MLFSVLHSDFTLCFYFLYSFILNHLFVLNGSVDIKQLFLPASCNICIDCFMAATMVETCPNSTCHIQSILCRYDFIRLSLP